MNPEKLSRAEIEAKLTALLLGELPAEEAALLRWAIAQDAGLAALHTRLQQTIGLVREVAAQPEETPADATALKLSQERRAKLLAHFQTPRATPLLLPPLPARAGSAWTRRRAALSSLATIAAVLALVAVLAGLMLPALSKAKAKAQRISQLNAAKMRELQAKMDAQDSAEPQVAAAAPMPPVTPPPPAAEIVLPRAEGGGAEGFNLDAVTVEYAKHEGERPAQPAREGGVYKQEIVGYNNVTLNAADKNDLVAAKPAKPVSPPTSTVTVTGSGNVTDEWRSDKSERAQSSPVTPSILVAETAPGDATFAGVINGKTTSSKMIPTLKPAEGDGRLRGIYNDDFAVADRESGDKNGKLPVSNNQWSGTLAGNWEEKELGGGRGGGGGRGKESDAIGFGRTKPDVVSPGSFALAESAFADDSKLTKGLGEVSGGKSAEATARYYADVSSPAKSKANQSQLAVDTKRRASEVDEVARSGELALGYKYDIGGGRADSIGRGNVSHALQGAELPAAGPQAIMERNVFGLAPAKNEPLPLDATPAPVENVERRALTVTALPNSLTFGATESKKQLAEREKLVPLENGLPQPLVVGTPVPARLPSAPELEAALKRVDKAQAVTDGDKIPVLGDGPVSGDLFANKIDSSGSVEGLQRGTKLAGEISGVAGVTRDEGNSVNYRLTTGTDSLTKSGTGNWTMTGNNTYSGGTTFSAGTLVNGGTLAVGQVAAEKSKEKDREGQGAPKTIKFSGITTATNALVASSDFAADPPAPKAALPAPIPQPEILTRSNAFSTFSLNVSDVSFKLAAASLEQGALPEAASIRSEEFINAFDYRDPEAAAGQPLAFVAERARYPFAHNRDLLRFSVKTAAAGRAAGRALNLVLLLDNSGSMERADRVAIIRESLRVLATQLQPQDTVSVVTFARTARLWADGVRGDQAGKTLAQAGDITPEGGTNLEEAMRLAYATARRHYRATGMNRVVLLTDGAANLGDVDPAALKAKVESFRQQGIALDCFGIGSQDFNDDLLEQLSRNGDGRYAFLNSPTEASTEFAAKLAGALQVAASDVKVQVEFNPQRVTSYRQIGYAKHQLTKEQFRDNTVDAAEIAAQEAGNALYTVETRADGVGPIATVRVRYKVPGTTEYRETSWEVPYTGSAAALEQSSPAMRLAATASAFSEWLAASPFAQEVTPDALLKLSRGLPEVYGADVRPTKLEWMIRQAKRLAGK